MHIQYTQDIQIGVLCTLMVNIKHTNYQYQIQIQKCNISNI